MTQPVSLSSFNTQRATLFVAGRSHQHTPVLQAAGQGKYQVYNTTMHTQCTLRVSLVFAKPIKA
eukprot:1870465-Amphidinium_carterae.1